jgi:hypothetical protein
VEETGDMRRQRLQHPLAPLRRRHQGGLGVCLGTTCQVHPVRLRARPVDTQQVEPGLGPPAAGRIDLGFRQQRGQRVDVDAHTDAPFRARLQRHCAAPAERVDDDIARTAVAADERLRQGSRESPQLAAHGMEGVSPKPLLELPVGRHGEAGQRLRLT